MSPTWSKGVSRLTSRTPGHSCAGPSGSRTALRPRVLAVAAMLGGAPPGAIARRLGVDEATLCHRDLIMLGRSECSRSECGRSECGHSECGHSECGHSECGHSERGHSERGAPPRPEATGSLLDDGSEHDVACRRALSGLAVASSR